MLCLLFISLFYIRKIIIVPNYIFSFVCIFTGIFSINCAHAAAKVAIVIDDMGYRYTDKHALKLPGEITYSILPHTTYGKKLALKANAQQKDVLLHIPMEAENKKRLGPGALTSDMNAQQIEQSLAASFAEIPFAIGINNHMGSHLTQQYQAMAWTMSYLKAHQLIFLDSKTSPNSQAEQAAIDLGVPVQSRHVFLDNHLDSQYIAKQFQQLIRHAQKHHLAIAIAHPHPETVASLTSLIPTLAEHDIELVPLSTLYEKSSIHTASLASD